MLLFILLFDFIPVHGASGLLVSPANDSDSGFKLKQGTLSPTETVIVGSCRIAIWRQCPDPEVNFFLYSKNHAEVPERIRIGADMSVSNLSMSAFDPKLPSKIIIHGYNSDMFLNVLMELKNQYLIQDKSNVFFVDWGPLAQSPCYFGAVWNIRHVGTCTAQLVERLRELNATYVHLIGFSLGGQVTNYVANTLRPYQVDRITGLDPAGPGFLTAGPEHRLDKGDALFVDVIHTNAFMQGILEESGHVDFYVNGGVVQPGCWAETRYFACNHHRAPLYFAESINTPEGFWGWPCPSYGQYLLGECLPKEPQIVMGEHVTVDVAKGLHLAITDSVAPYAVGKFTGPNIEILLARSNEHRRRQLENYRRQVLESIDEDDVVEALRNASGLPLVNLIV